MSQALPNPALDAFKSKLTSGTDLSEAMKLGRDQLRKALQGKDQLYTKWRRNFSYICVVVCLWSLFHVTEVAKLLPSEEASVDNHQELILLLRHAASSLTLFMLSIIPHLQDENYRGKLKSWASVLGMLEMLVAIMMNNKAAAAASQAGAGAMKKLRHYPFSTILAVMGYLQDAYMDMDVKRSSTQFKEMEETMKAMAKPKKS